MSMLTCRKVELSKTVHVHETLTNISVLRIQWCKQRARAHRWVEECLLLREEMRRVLQFFEWRATQWEARIAQDRLHTGAILEGATAYAHHQAALQRALRERCITLWAADLADPEDVHDTSCKHLSID